MISNHGLSDSGGFDPGTALPGDVGMAISEEDFARIRDLLHAGFGIKLANEKRALVVGRLRKLLLERGGISFGEYYRQITSDETGTELSELINRLSTNHTFFNRENDHFAFFRDTAMREAAERARRQGRKDLRVWCAASSTGEEPYMLAMMMREAMGSDFRHWEMGLLATDISARALAVARRGLYSPERMADLPGELRKKYFHPRGPDFEAANFLREDITYRRLNLINPEYPFKRRFACIFCRNVMIYFDQPTKEAVVARMARHLEPGGYLFIGHSESLGRQTPDYDYVRPAVYRRRSA
ncbi:MAG TPA: CheR family methyltransferase [Fibrobacteria bacterium]|nr:CheR family methyltransferase [Fibrobacteria bacterium]